MNSNVTLRPDDDEAKLINGAKDYYSEKTATRAIYRALSDAPKFIENCHELQGELEQVREELASLKTLIKQKFDLEEHLKKVVA